MTSAATASILFGIALGASAIPAMPEGILCPDRDVAVRNADAGLADRACRAVASASAILATCGLYQTRPMTIEVVEAFPEDHGPCIASYDCNTDLLRILAPERLDDHRHVSGAFSVLTGEELFDGLVAHELVHALLEQSDLPPTSRTAHEFLAYAMQLESLSEDRRAEFLALRGYDDPVTPDMINPALLLFAPAVFAANAWLYFDGPGGRCASVERIRAGETLFPLMEP